MRGTRCVDFHCILLSDRFACLRQDPLLGFQQDDEDAQAIAAEHNHVTVLQCLQAHLQRATASSTVRRTLDDLAQCDLDPEHTSESPRQRPRRG